MTHKLYEPTSKVPPKYTPALRIRVANTRTKQVGEFDFELPLEGFIGDMFPIVQKLRAVLEAQGILAKSEPVNAG